MQSVGFVFVCFMIACAGVCTQKNSLSDALLQLGRNEEPPTPKTLLEPLLFASAVARLVTRGDAGLRVPRQTTQMSREEYRRRVERLMDHRDVMRVRYEEVERERAQSAAWAREKQQQQQQEKSDAQARAAEEAERQASWEWQNAEWQHQEQLRAEEEEAFQQQQQQQQVMYLCICYWYHVHPPGSH